MPSAARSRVSVAVALVDVFLVVAGEQQADPPLEFLPVPEAAKDITFAGTIPDEANVELGLYCKAPKHLAWDVFTREKKDGGSMVLLNKGTARG